MMMRSCDDAELCLELPEPEQLVLRGVDALLLSEVDVHSARAGRGQPGAAGGGAATYHERAAVCVCVCCCPHLVAEHRSSGVLCSPLASSSTARHMAAGPTDSALSPAAGSAVSAVVLAAVGGLKHRQLRHLREPEPRPLASNRPISRAASERARRGSDIRLVLALALQEK